MAMIFKRIRDAWLLGAAIVMGCIAPWGTAVAQDGGSYAIVSSVIAGGGATSMEGGSFSLSVTVGETEAGLVTGGSYAVDAGFLSAALSEANLCVGDCNGSGEVTVDEILTLVSIALGSAQPAACSNGGLPVGGDVNIAVILQAVNHALNGCGGG